MDDILVRQKDMLWKWINSRSFYAALIALTILKELWIDQCYAYKGRELCTVILREVGDSSFKRELATTLLSTFVTAEAGHGR